MVDLATLTGAMIISLGHEYGGMFSNDDGLADALLEAGARRAATSCGGCRWARPMTRSWIQPDRRHEEQRRAARAARSPPPASSGASSRRASNGPISTLPAWSGRTRRATSTTRARPASASPCSTATRRQSREMSAVIRLGSVTAPHSPSAIRGEMPCRSPSVSCCCCWPCCRRPRSRRISTRARSSSPGAACARAISTRARTAVIETEEDASGLPSVGLRRRADFALLPVDHRRRHPRARAAAQRDLHHGAKRARARPALGHRARRSAISSSCR